MAVPLNCLRLDDAFDDIIKVNVSDLKPLIWRTKKELDSSGTMKLWKVELEDENKLKDVSTKGT